MNTNELVERLIEGSKNVNGWLAEAVSVASNEQLRQEVLETSEEGRFTIPIRSGRVVDIDLMDRRPLDISSIKSEVDIKPERLTASVGSTTMVEDLNNTLNSVNMKIDAIVGFRGISIGGLIAMGLSTSHRLPSRLNLALIGLEVIDNNGNEFFIGRRTLKGVAGYHINSLFISSFGRYGYIKNLIFRISPINETSKVLLVRLNSVSDYLKFCIILNSLSSYIGSIYISRSLSFDVYNIDNPICIFWLSGLHYTVDRDKQKIFYDVYDLLNTQILLNTVINPDFDFIAEGCIIIRARFNPSEIQKIENIKNMKFIIRSDGLFEILSRIENIGNDKIIDSIRPHSIYYKTDDRLLVCRRDSNKLIHI
ncbi:MAG: hypothetical protein ACUVWP_06015 [bacterium]